MNKERHKSEYIDKLFRYIENNISTNMDTKSLSNISYVSRDKLYYDFYSVSGHSVKEYIRKRRLSNALALIKASDFSIADIAFRCGYSSHQALCRAVKQTICLTPSEYKDGDRYYFFPPYHGEPIQSIFISNMTIHKILCIRFFSSKLTEIENRAVNIFLQTFPDYNGRILGRNGKQRGNRFCYELYLTDIGKNYDILTSSGFEITDNTSCLNGNFAILSVKNNESEINSAWDYLYSRWLQNSMFEYTGEPYYEEYILKNDKPTKLKLYLPIKKRDEETKITLINNPKLRFITAKAKGYNAEEKASQFVMDYLCEHGSYIINNSKELYLKKTENTYICGVRINPNMCVVNSENIFIINTEQNNYLMLESNVAGDYEKYVDLLLSFSRDNGMIADENGIFAIYDGAVSFSNLKIKIYCPIKFRTV